MWYMKAHEAGEFTLIIHDPPHRPDRDVWLCQNNPILTINFQLPRRRRRRRRRRFTTQQQAAAVAQARNEWGNENDSAIKQYQIKTYIQARDHDYWKLKSTAQAADETKFPEVSAPSYLTQYVQNYIPYHLPNQRTFPKLPIMSITIESKCGYVALLSYVRLYYD